MDLLRAGIRTHADHPASTLAHTPVLTVYPSMPLLDAGDLMLTQGVSHLVVADQDTNRPVGVISTFDVGGGVAWDAIGRSGPPRRGDDA